jgi:hypothetical protein
MEKPFVRSASLLTDRRGWLVWLALCILSAYYRQVWAFLIRVAAALLSTAELAVDLLGCRRLWAADPLSQTSVFAGDTLRLVWRFENRWGFP